MKKETFEKAKELETRIDHISKLLEFIGTFDYKLDPPTRQSNYDIGQSHGDGYINLNEGEVVFLRTALEGEKLRLQQEFGRL